MIEIRKKAPDFLKWIIPVARKYFRQSKNYTFKQYFYHLVDMAVFHSEIIFEEYGDKTPYAAHPEGLLDSDEDKYQKLKNNIS